MNVIELPKLDSINIWKSKCFNKYVKTELWVTLVHLLLTLCDSVLFKTQCQTISIHGPYAALPSAIFNATSHGHVVHNLCFHFKKITVWVTGENIAYQKGFTLNVLLYTYIFNEWLRFDWRKHEDNADFNSLCWGDQGPVITITSEYL